MVGVDAVALVKEYFPLRRVEDLRSGDSIVQPDGWWDRVYSACPWNEDGVEVPGMVFVQTDRHYNSRLQLPVGTLVKVV